MQTIKGFVESVRDLPKIQFIVVRDKGCQTQCTLLKNEANAELNAKISTLTKESVVEVSGELKDNPSVKLNGEELLISEIKIHSIPVGHIPVSDTSGEDTLADWRFLELRKPENLEIFKTQTRILMEIRLFLDGKDFIEIFTPKIIGTASESGAEVFKLDYFGKEAYLAQSPQFYKQMAMASDFNKVFEIAPAFRADKSNTNRHSSEFISIDLEMAWTESHHDIMEFQEEMITHCMRHAFGTIPNAFAKITFHEAKKIVGGTSTEDFTPAEEKAIGVWGELNKETDFVFVTDYPSSLRPFYHERDEKTGLTKSYDLLYKGVEITSGAKREHRYEILEKQILEKGYVLEPLQDYVNFFKYGCPPHGGFGMGLARFIMLMLNLPNIKKVEFLHRGKNRLRP